MPKVLTMESTTQCGPAAATHGGDIAKASDAKLTVNGQAVLTKDSVLNKTVSGCQTVVSQTVAKCTSVAAVISQESTKLTVNGKPVLVGLTGKCAPPPPAAPPAATGTLFALAVQTKLDAK